MSKRYGELEMDISCSCCSNSRYKVRISLELEEEECEPGDFNLRTGEPKLECVDRGHARLGRFEVSGAYLTDRVIEEENE